MISFCYCCVLFYIVPLFSLVPIFSQYCILFWFKILSIYFDSIIVYLLCCLSEGILFVWILFCFIVLLLLLFIFLVCAFLPVFCLLIYKQIYIYIRGDVGHSCLRGGARSSHFGPITLLVNLPSLISLHLSTLHILKPSATSFPQVSILSPHSLA